MAKVLLTRRNFLRTSAAGMCTAGGVFAYTSTIEPHWVQITKRELPIRSLPASLVGKSLVLTSDLHVGPIVDRDYLIRSMLRINDLEPDILALTGDFMSCRRCEQVDAAAEVLSHLKPAKLATVAVLGNHDYGSRWLQTQAADGLTLRMRRMNMHVLSNEAIDVHGLTIGGLDDYWGPRFDPNTAISRLDPLRANLVLCHNPDVADEPVWNGYRGWILCGHTHGGQCKAPFFTPPILPVKNRRYVEGEVDLHDGRKLYINRGLGYLRKVRFNVRPEITMFTLAAANAT